jgi:hypothetical protein
MAEPADSARPYFGNLIQLRRNFLRIVDATVILSPADRGCGARRRGALLTKSGQKATA